MAGSKSVVKTVLTVKMLFPFNVLRLHIDFSEITLKNRFPPKPLFLYICFGATLGGGKMKLLLQTVFMF